MKIIKILDRETKKEIIQMNYETPVMDYHTIAMYTMACISMIKEKDIEAMLSLITNLKMGTVDEEGLIEIFLKDFDVQYEDIDRKIEKASSMEDIFGK